QGVGCGERGAVGGADRGLRLDGGEFWAQEAYGTQLHVQAGPRGLRTEEPVVPRLDARTARRLLPSYRREVAVPREGRSEERGVARRPAAGHGCPEGVNGCALVRGIANVAGRVAWFVVVRHVRHAPTAVRVRMRRGSSVQSYPSGASGGGGAQAARAW